MPRRAGAYSAEVKLETACSRERVASATKAFTNAGQALETGRTLAVQGLSPIAGTIENFEKGKRDGDVMVARYVSELGTFTAASAVTDANGKVQVMFKAGNLKGTAILRAYFIYELPTGCDAVAGGTALIQIEDVPARAYLLSAKYTERSTSKMESRVEFDVAPVYSLEESKYQARDERTLRIWGVAVNNGSEPGEVDLATVNVSTGGTWNAVITHETYNFGTAPGKVGESREFLQNTDIGTAIPEESGLVFLYNPAQPEGNSFELTGSVVNRHHGYSWYASTEKGSGSDITDTTESLLMHFSLTVPLGGKGSITRNDSAFSITLKHDTAWSESTGQVYHKTRSVELTATVKPLSDLVNGIRLDRGESGRAQPGRTRLSRKLFDVLGRWSGTAGKRPAAVYLDGIPAR